MNTIKNVNLTHHELLELIAVVKVIKKVAVDQRNAAEAKLMSELTRKLLDFDLDKSGSVVKLDRMTRFSLWLCMEKYIEFCTETKQNEEYVLAVGIADKLSG